MEYKIIDGELTEVCLGETETEVTIPDGVVSIGGGFSGNHVIRCVFIPEGVKRIGSGAFFNCTNLAEINLPESVEEIEDRAFWFCEQLTIKAVPGSYGEKWVNDIPQRLALGGGRTQYKPEPEEWVKDVPRREWVKAAAQYECGKDEDPDDPLIFLDGLPAVGTTVSATVNTGFCCERGDIFRVIYHVKDAVPDIVILECRLTEIMNVLRTDNEIGSIFSAWVRVEVLSCESLQKYALMEGVTDEEEAQRQLNLMEYYLFNCDGEYYTMEYCIERKLGIAFVGFRRDCGPWTVIEYTEGDLDGFYWIYHDERGFDHLIASNQRGFEDNDTDIGNLILGKHEDVCKHYYSKEDFQKFKVTHAKKSFADMEHFRTI